jgi:hypothetical protein
MSSAPQSAATEANELPTDIAELSLVIGGLPDEFRARLTPILSRVMESTKRRRRILSLVQDALSQLRLDMKYLVFDLEATRRERDEYRQRLDPNSPTSEGDEAERFDEGEDFAP